MSGQNLLLLGAVQQAVPDPYFEYTTLLLPGNGTNGAQNNTFLDSSTNAFSITRNGNTTQGTFSPFSQTGWGNYFDGNGDTLSLADDNALDLGTGDFSIEGWVYLTGFPGSGTNAFVSKFASGNYAYLVQIVSASTLRFYTGNSGSLSSYYDYTYTWVLNQWTHIAITRESGTLRAFVNGTLLGSNASVTQNLTNTSTLIIGNNGDGGGQDFNGYISNLRIVKGTAVYTSNFTPSTTPLTAITNTSLLTCQSNRFIDNSTNAFAITRNGDVSVQAFSPFNPTASWSAATYGGSGYFDGSGDYLTAPDNAALDLSGDFTVEAWVYLPNVSGEKCVFHNHTSDNNGIALNVNSAAPRLLSGSGSWNVILDSSIAISPNCWNHIAGTRSGNTYTIWVNGVSGGTASSSATPSYSGGAQIGRFTSGVPLAFSGYMASPRVVKGTAVYTSTFTPPTAPLTAITNTSLLCNFTNAGIFDATSKNDLETVGNAQISTTQSKFGGSSMYFDGTGDWLLTQAVLGASDSGDFTVEGWFYINAAGSFYPSIQYYAATTDIAVINFNNGSSYYAALGSDTINGGNAATITNASSTVSGQTWNHVAWARYGSTITFYINGLASGTLSLAYKFQPMKLVGVSYYSVGSSPGFYQAFNGYINDLRVTKGIARYTANFTAPTAAFPLL